MEHQRTHTCGQLRLENVGETVVLNGWVDTVRDHGGLMFFEIRDRYGFTQVVVDPEEQPSVRDLKSEWVVAVKGEVKARPEENKNPNKATGDIDLYVDVLEVLNRSKVPPFEVQDDLATREELRLEYRYLDMRRRPVLSAMEMRSRVTQIMRREFHDEGFMEVETPVLMKTSPEGARDFIVPSRLHLGKVYGLPQSPQLFKQTLMVCGIDKYFQICKCFRDEDLRADRQPEFTQLDMEMSFVRQDDVFRVIERTMAAIYQELKGIEVPTPFPRYTYHEAMNRWGIDKPDVRFDLELFDLSDVAKESGFKVFKGAVESGGIVRGLVLPGGAELTRKMIDAAEAVAKEYGARGLAWLKLTDEGPTGGISKFLGAAELEAIKDRGGAKPGDLVVFGADTWTTALTALGQVRLHFGKTRDLIDKSRAALLWVTDFPLFEWSEDDQRWQAMHHMFTAPRQPLPAKGEDLSDITADLYDLVIDGNEIGSGSIRIHRPEIQTQIFDHVGITPEEADLKFGWFLKALDYGAPPHGGIALGLDRIVMLLVNGQSLREVIAFPKLASGVCPLTQSPSPPDAAQWDELGLGVVEQDANEG
ncbi:MAG: aspartate--tRNA ligase [Planctomycetes bacterium]|nr:aspartate--tRNA ligase [Planctomycetota bacterium]